MQNEIKSYEDLEVWKLGIGLTLRTYSIVARFPPSERFELSSQMRRAAVSIPSNIAEGHARRQPKPFLNHVNIALGSLAELSTCFVLAMRLGFISRDIFDDEQRETAQLRRMLHGLASSLERRIKQQRLGLSLGLSVWFLPTVALSCSIELRFLLLRGDVFTLALSAGDFVLARIDVDVFAHAATSAI